MPQLTRRNFIKAGALATGGLLLGIGLPNCAGSRAVPFNAFIRVHTGGGIDIVTPVPEIGQNAFTTLPRLIARAMDADWDEVAVELAPLDFAFQAGSGRQAAFQSGSLREWHDRCTVLGAEARRRLIAAAAAGWEVPAGECATARSTVVHEKSGRRESYAALAEAAAKLAPGALPELPDAPPAAETAPPGRRDAAPKSRGEALYAADRRPAGTLFAAVRMTPGFDGRIAGFEAEAATKQPGVTGVFELPGAVAVVAESWWRASRALAEIDVTFEPGPAVGLSSAAIDAALRRALDRPPGHVFVDRGSIPAARRDAFATLTAVYDVPVLAHACLEPMTATAIPENGGMRLIVPAQDVTAYAAAVAGALDLPRDRIETDPVFVGGSFGRRVTDTRIAIQAALLARETGRPVQVQWDRRSDFQHDHYRPPAKIRLFGGLDSGGAPMALSARIAAPALYESLGRSDLLEDGIDPAAVEGLRDMPYAPAANRVEWVRQDFPMPFGFWRSQAYQANIFALESFIDELADLADQDPLEFRRALLAEQPRLIGVLEAATAAAGWAESDGATGKGIALVRMRGSAAALVAEVAVEKSRIRPLRLTAAVDAGAVVDPDGLRAQIEGGLVMGLGAAMTESMRIERGGAQAGNFDDYPVPRMRDVPEIDIAVLSSEAPPGGAGELAVPLVAPALANAVFRLTGHRIRRLPLAEYPLDAS